MKKYKEMIFQTDTEMAKTARSKTLHGKIKPESDWTRNRDIPKTITNLLYTLFRSRHTPASQMFVVGKDLFRQLEHKLVKAKVHLRLNLIVQELLAELGEGVVGTVIIQV